MKRSLSLLASLLLVFMTVAQTSTTAAVGGQIFIPTIQRIKVEQLHQGPIVFDNATDLTQGKYFSGFYKVSVLSNTPWLVEVMTTQNLLTNSGGLPGGGNQSLPADVISLKGNTGFIPLSTTPQTLVISNNNLLQNQYLIDARFNPGWNYAGGQYSTTLLFTLTPQ